MNDGVLRRKPSGQLDSISNGSYFGFCNWFGQGCQHFQPGICDVLGRKRDYVKGVVGLAKGLRKVKTAYPLVVAVLPDVPAEHRRILEDQGCVVREIEPVNPPENQTSSPWPTTVINYSKLRIWEFVEYSKMIYLDGDIQVRGATRRSTRLGTGQQCPEKVKWPAEMGPAPPLYFNAGMFVFEPCLSVYDDLLTTLKITTPTSFAEQETAKQGLSFLSMKLFLLSPFHPPTTLVLAMLWRHPENIDLQRTNVVHYCAAVRFKAMEVYGKEENMEREDIKMLVKKWWDIYNDESLDYRNSSADGKPFTVALSEAV
ncbi:Galactinol synthase 2 [Vitis vinifera]|uniref:Hexosyltransferase n=1 Tax=Vitis vinifera TaxID=29760 RepID=A0A438CFW0_VITVI|nr:Galactinol synthase 2 [Vitis vinifera]